MAEAADFQGTSPSPARRWLRRTGALLAGAPLLAGLLQLPTASPARAATGDRTVSIAVDSLTPSVATDGDTVTVSGTVTNTGKQAVTEAQVDLRLGQELTTRSGIDTAARATGSQPGTDGLPLGGKYVKKFAKLTQGVSQPFSIEVPVDELDLGGNGVYQLAVSLSGETAAQPWTQVLGVQRTFLPYQPDEADTRTKTTVLWPLISTVHMTAQTGSNESQTPVFRDNDLATELAPGGRLERMLALGKDLDVTWVVDPDLLASVDAMTRSFRVQGENGTTTAGSRADQEVAKRWLASLQDAVLDNEVVALPFADPDLASLAHNGTAVTGSLGHLKEATDVASDTVESILHVEPTTDFAWPVDGAVDPSIMKVATSAGADKVIARSDSLQETAGLTYTPSAARPVGGGTTAVVADARLSTAFQGDMTRASTATLARQRFLAQSLALNLQTDKQRSIVVAPQRMPTAAQAQALAEAVTALQNSGWTEFQDLTTAAAAKPDPGATARIPAKSAYPSSLRKKELQRTAFEQIAATQDKLDRFKVVLSNESRVVTPFGRAMNREMSTSWRGRATEAAGYRDDVESYLESLTDQVSLIDKSEVKLSGRSATIPVTVQNNLVQGVDDLVLRLTSTSPRRLKIGGAAYEEQPVAVSGGHSQTVKFTTSAEANGQAEVIAQLYTRDGQKYGAEVRFDVKVTEFTATVMLVIGGGFLLLVLAGFRMYTQRKRAARQSAEKGPDASGEAADTPEEPQGPDDRPERESAPGAVEGDPEQPSDLTPDTPVESADPSGTGERVDR
ncbi:DUF6049 family protein [Streptomyces sp. NPDC048002]|uniref:DUF6049 family protein n=1 Tax=unclassified Streptomyces TaxID=2593676 RepID=UPI00340CE868